MRWVICDFASTLFWPFVRFSDELMSERRRDPCRGITSSAPWTTPPTSRAAQRPELLDPAKPASIGCPPADGHGHPPRPRTPRATRDPQTPGGARGALVRRVRRPLVAQPRPGGLSCFRAGPAGDVRGLFGQGLGPLLVRQAHVPRPTAFLGGPADGRSHGTSRRVPVALRDGREPERPVTPKPPGRRDPAPLVPLRRVRRVGVPAGMGIPPGMFPAGSGPLPHLRIRPPRHPIQMSRMWPGGVGRYSGTER